MQSLSLFLSLLVGSSSAMNMHRPTFLDIRSPSDLQMALQAAMVTTTLQLSQQSTNCYDLNNIQMDQGSLPPVSPGLELYHVAVGRGTQNYSCVGLDASAPPFALGAVATLYNATCLMQPASAKTFNSLFQKFVNSTYQTSPATDPLAALESGHHYFTNGNSTATFNLHTDLSLPGNNKVINKNLGITFSKKMNATAAPATAYYGQDGSKPVPWLKLAVTGPSANPPTAQTAITQTDAIGNVQEIYRLNTAGGAAPATCGAHAGGVFEVQYAAEYWFFHSANGAQPVPVGGGQMA